MKVLSLFDGCGMAYQALKDLGITVDRYYSSEIDKYAITIAKKNHPDIIELGDVTKVRGIKKDWTKVNVSDIYEGGIDLLIGGSPCTNLSIAGNREGLKGEQSKLFYEYVRLLKEIKPKYFLLENVASMTKENSNIMSEILGVEPTLINSALLTAQNRKRLYRFGERQEDGTYKKIEVEQPKDKGILIKDILEDEVDEKYYINEKALERYTKNGTPKGLCINKAKTLTASMAKGYGNDGCTTIRVGGFNKQCQGDRVYSEEGKGVTLSALGGGRGAKTGLYAVAKRGRYNEEGKVEQQIEIGGEKANSLTTVQKDSMVIIQKVGDRDKNSWGVHEDKSYTLPANPMSDRGQMVFNGRIRKLTPLEAERLQSLPENYTSGVSDSQRYRMVGNGFTVNVISHILSYIK